MVFVKEPFKKGLAKKVTQSEIHPTSLCVTFLVNPFLNEVQPKKKMSLTQNFSVPNFSSTQFLILCISWGSDNITVSNNKNKSKKLFARPRYKVPRIVTPQFCQHGLLIHVCLCVSVRAHIGWVPMCISESAHRLKLQFLIFSTSPDCPTEPSWQS